MGIVADSGTETRVFLRPFSSHQYLRFTLIMHHGLRRVQIRTAQLNERNEILAVGQINYILQKYSFLVRVFIRRSDRLTAIKISIISEKYSVVSIYNM